MNPRIDDPTHQILRRTDESPSDVDATSDIAERWSDQSARPGDTLDGMAAGECNGGRALIGNQPELPSHSCRNRNSDECSQDGQKLERSTARIGERLSSLLAFNIALGPWCLRKPAIEPARIAITKRARRAPTSKRGRAIH